MENIRQMELPAGLACHGIIPSRFACEHRHLNVHEIAASNEYQIVWILWFYPDHPGVADCVTDPQACGINAIEKVIGHHGESFRRNHPANRKDRPKATLVIRKLSVVSLRVAS